MSRANRSERAAAPAADKKTEKAAGFYTPVPESAASIKPKPKVVAAGPTIAPVRKEPLPKTRTRAKPEPRAIHGAPVTVNKKQPSLTADAVLAVEDPLHHEPDSLAAEIARIEALGVKPFGSMTQRLALPPIPGYALHWFNDSPGRIQQKLGRGWTSVKDKQGRPVKIIVGRGPDNGGLYAYAMKIPQKFRDAEMAALHAEARARIGEMQKAGLRGAPGGQAKAPGGTAADEASFYNPRNPDGSGPAVQVQEPR